MENPFSKNPGAERRKFPRLSLSADVKYSLIKLNSSQEAVSTKNISAVGICIVVYEDLRIGSILTLNIYLPDSDAPLSAKGRVIWKSEFKVGFGSKPRFDVGVEFLELDEKDKERIFQYVAQPPKPKKRGEK